MDAFGNPLPSCSWEDLHCSFPSIEGELEAMEIEHLEANPLTIQPTSPLTDAELYGILSENILGYMETDDSEMELEPDEEEIMPVMDSSSDRWLPGNPESTSTKLPFTKTSGLKEEIEGTPIGYFETICNSELLEMLKFSTNDYGERQQAVNRGPHSRSKTWKPVTCEDLKIFFGLIFHMGFIKINRLSDYWKKDIYFNQPIFAKTMSRNRFLLILRMLSASTGSNTISYEKVKNVIEFFNKRMLELYYPTINIVIDESMMLWRGRLRFRQYMKGKKTKYGLKFYALADQLGVVLKLHLYGGASDALVGGINHVNKVVMHLMQAYLNVGHHLYMDNFYTSVDLAEDLFNKNTYCTGTLRKQRKNNPKTVIKTKLKKSELCIQHKNNICVIKWLDKRELLVISTKYNGTLENITDRRGNIKLKPQMVNHYNKNMNGIDRHDQMLSYYSCEHKSLRWYKKVIIHIMQVILVNSYFLYNKYSSAGKSNLYDFRLSVIKSLLEPHIPSELEIAIGTKIHCLKKLDKDAKGKIKRKRCIHCWNMNKKRVASSFACENCPQQPGICIECFRKYHKYQ